MELTRESMGVVAAVYVLGMLTGWAVGRRERPVRPLSGPETAEESLARLRPGSSVPKRGGQAFVANAPRLRTQDQVPAAPPRGGSGIVVNMTGGPLATGGVLHLPAGTRWRADEEEIQVLRVRQMQERRRT